MLVSYPPSRIVEDVLTHAEDGHILYRIYVWHTSISSEMILH